MFKGKTATKRLKPNWSDPATTAENEVLPGWLKWAWTGRGVSYSLNVILMMQLTYYCTDLLGMAPALVGSLLLASKLFDGVTDLIAGYILDKTNTRWGKARPYDIFIALMWIGTVLLFSVPNFGIVGKSVYIFIMYALVNSVCVTFVGAADNVFLGRAIRNNENRMSVTSFQGIFIMLISIVTSVALPQMISAFGGEKAGWTLIALIFAVPLAIVGSIRMLTVKEVVTTENSGSGDSAKLTLKESIKVVLKNKYAFILSAIVIICNLNTAMSTSVNTYYFKWIFGDIGLASLVSLPQMLLPVILIFIPAISKKLGTGKLLRVGITLEVVGYAIRLIGGTNMVTIMVGTVFTSIGIIPISVLQSIYTLETIDYGEWKTGVRVEGLLASMGAFAMKVGSGIGSSVLGIMMGMSGYLTSESAVSQPESALSMIRFLFNGLPILLMVLMLFLAFTYRIDKVQKQMNEELAVRRAKAKAGTEATK